MIYNCIDAYKEVGNPGKWLDCPNCGLKPKIWEFDNGRSTACGCGENRYQHFSIHAESIMSVVGRFNGSTTDYDSDALRKNWNWWVETGEEVFKTPRNDGRW